MLSIGSFILGLYCVLTGWSNGAKWIGTAGLLATVTGVVQLEVSGFSGRILDHYTNDKKYPYGPPSYITREIIYNPDKPVSMWVRSVCFFTVKTGFWLIVFGTIVQVFAVWL